MSKSTNQGPHFLLRYTVVKVGSTEPIGTLDHSVAQCIQPNVQDKEISWATMPLW
jgi:hypothetical protein